MKKINLLLVVFNLMLIFSACEKETYIKYDYYIENASNSEIYLSYNYKYNNDSIPFFKLEQNDYETKGFSLLYTEHITEEELYYGRMPKISREIVVEKWVLEKMIEETTLGKIYKSIADLCTANCVSEASVK